MKSRVLGKGLNALIKERIDVSDKSKIVHLIHINNIKANNLQPRKIFDTDLINELADSISKQGLLQPIIVNDKDESGKYLIIAGERRYRACKIAGLSEVPVIIKQLNDVEILEISIIENIQRAQLTVVEEAESFARLIEEFNYTHAAIAEKLGKSRSYISNILRLNSLPDSVKDKLNNGMLTMGHAKCIMNVPDIENFAERIVQKGLSVRQTESLVKKTNNAVNKSKNKNKDQFSEDDLYNDDMLAIAESLSAKLSTQVKMKHYKAGGEITLLCEDLESLDKIISKLSN